MSLAEDLEQLRAATRAAHEATQDLRAAVREATTIRDAVLAELAAKSVEDRVGAAVASGLADYKTALDKAIADATAAVFRRFDTLRDTLLGESRRQRRRGEPSIPELLGAAENPGEHS